MGWGGVVEGWLDVGGGGDRVSPTHIHTHAYAHVQGFPQ